MSLFFYLIVPLQGTANEGNDTPGATGGYGGISLTGIKRYAGLKTGAPRIINPYVGLNKKNGYSLGFTNGRSACSESQNDNEADVRLAVQRRNAGAFSFFSICRGQAGKTP